MYAHVCTHTLIFQHETLVTDSDCPCRVLLYITSDSLRCSVYCLCSLQWQPKACADRWSAVHAQWLSACSTRGGHGDTGRETAQSHGSEAVEDRCHSDWVSWHNHLPHPPPSSLSLSLFLSLSCACFSHIINVFSSFLFLLVIVIILPFLSWDLFPLCVYATHCWECLVWTERKIVLGLTFLFLKNHKNATQLNCVEAKSLTLLLNGYVMTWSAGIREVALGHCT